MRNGSRGICYQFRDSGSCSYGSNCRFSHFTGQNNRVENPLWNKVSLARKYNPLFTTHVTFLIRFRSIQKSRRPTIPGLRQFETQQDLDAISTFFSRYPSFVYDKQRGVAEEFYRMCDFFGWDRDDNERKEARQAFKDAMVIRFNGLYGTDSLDIGNWHKLCIAVSIVPLPATIETCKEVYTC